MEFLEIIKVALNYSKHVVIYFNDLDSPAAFVDNASEVPCIRHIDCQFFMTPTTLKPQCHQCSLYRENYLRCALRRCTLKNTESICAPNSHTNYRFLSQAQLTDRLRNVHSLLHKKSRDNKVAIILL